MIPLDYIQEWRSQAPWVDMRQVEQDLIISRILCDLFNTANLYGKVAFRGGTAIHKLLFQQPLRYSEDIDLVQTQPEPIGETINIVRNALKWLGNCRTKQTRHSTHLEFKFIPETDPNSTLKIKIEINTRDHKNLYGIKSYPFELNSSWYQAKTEILSFEPEELLGTKLKALLQRNKNRDLFDLYEGIRQCPIDFQKLVFCLEYYLAMDDLTITRADAEQRMLKKLQGNLTDDIAPLLPFEIGFNDDVALDAFNLVWRELISRIGGAPWKLSEKVIVELRNSKLPKLLKDYSYSQTHSVEKIQK